MKEYYTKLGRKTEDWKAYYWVSQEYKVEFKKLVKTAKGAFLNSPVEWAINRLRFDYGATSAGYMYN